MTKYIFKRLLFAIFALFILMSIVFFLMAALPNAPISKAPHETAEEFQQQLDAIGWNRPVIERYGLYWSGFCRGDFGQVFNKPGVTLQQYFFQNIPNTLYVASIAYVLSILLGFTFGITAAVFRGKWQDTVINIISVIFVSVPSFIIGILLLRLAGVLDLPQVFINFGTPDVSVGEFIASSVMPILSLTFGLASSLTYYVRNELVEVLSQDYIKTAMSKGLTKFQIIFKHGLRNSMIPALAIMGPSFLTVITGSIVLETIFQVKGVAILLYESVVHNQFNVIMFQTFFISGLYFLIILLVDVLYTIIDPRIKLSESSQSLFSRMVLSSTQRTIWVKKWIKARGPEYEWVDLNSSLYANLKEMNLIDEKNKTTKINSNILETYNIGNDKKYLVIGKDILKIEVEGRN